MVTRTELVAAIGERYRAGPRIARSPILDEFVAVNGYHRKHAIRLLSVTEQAPPVPRGARRRYGDEVRDALIVLWEASDRLCSKRLKPLIPVLLPALEHHGRLVVGPELRERLLAVSPASMDRLLSEIRLVAHCGRRRRPGSSSAVRRSDPDLRRLERSAARLRRGGLRRPWRDNGHRQLRPDDGADRYRDRLDRMPAGRGA